MEGSRFDRWTRRRFGTTAAGLLGTILALQAVPEADARHRKKKRRKRNRCLDLAKACTQSHEQCCGKLECQDFGRPTGFRCCKPEGASCSKNRNDECCPDLTCDSGGTCSVVF